MSDNLIIPDHARIMFAKTWRDALQQRESRARNLVTVRTGCTGSSSTIDINGTLEGEDVTGQRYKDVAINDTASTQRWVYPVEYQSASHLSKWDPNSIAPLVAPQGEQAVKHMGAYGRFMDRHLFAQMLGTAYETTTASATPTAVVLPAAQKIAKDYIAGGSGSDSNLTIAKLVRALEIFEAAEAYGQDAAEMGAKLCMGINASANKALLMSVESGLGAKLFSRDYMPPVLDANGFVKEFLGIHFVRTQLFTLTASVALLPIWVSTCVQLDIWEDSSVSMDRLPQKSNALQFLSQARLGATRIEDEGVVQIACYQP